MTKYTPTVSIDCRNGILLLVLTAATLLSGPTMPRSPEHSVARAWNEALLEAIRNDFARPTVHARNLFHTSIAMWDAWAAFDADADQVLHHERMSAADIQAAREAAISHAAYRLLSWRFASSPGSDPDDPDNTLRKLRDLMIELGYDPDFDDESDNSPAGLGIRIADTIIGFGLQDGANEANGYANTFYLPVNDQLDLDEPGNPDMTDPNRWQPLQQDAGFVDQSGNQVGQQQVFLSAEWGGVAPFSLPRQALSEFPDESGEFTWRVYHDPGPPPLLGGTGDTEFKDDMVTLIRYSSQLDPGSGSGSEIIDISPASRGNNALGSNDGTGYPVNPVTGQAYAPELVPRGDYLRVISEYWADGPASETPPGHWFGLLNTYVLDAPQLERRIGGVGDEVPVLEFDVKAYLSLGGAVHDAAVTAWGIKGYHDSVRPISAIRHMGGLGQSSDASDTGSYAPRGLPLEPDLIEIVTSQSASDRHAHLADHIGEIAVLSWRGHGHDPETEIAGVGWILAENWWPYQQQGFVTPPFAGYVSGHSTFSRAAAEILTLLTGSEFFPGGLAEYCVSADGFLEFERGPSVDFCLQWARYYDASDESGISRIYGGIHPTFDDLPGRVIGRDVGVGAWQRAVEYFEGTAHDIFEDTFEQGPATPIIRNDR